MRRIAILSIVSAILIFSNSHAQSQATHVEQGSWVLSVDGYIAAILKRFEGYDPKRFIGEYGPLVNLDTKIVENQYSNMKDIICSFESKKVEVVERYITHLHKWIILSLKIKGKGIFEISGIDIGKDKSILRIMMGDDYKESMALIVRFENDVIAEILVYNLE